MDRKFDLKENFLDNYVGENQNLKSTYLFIFNLAAPYEKRFGNDLCRFSIEEAQTFCDEAFTVRISSRETYLAKVRVYCDWCGTEGKVKDATMAFYNIDLKKSAKTAEKMVGSPKDLSRRLDSMFRSTKEESTDDQLRAAFWLAFCGVPSWEKAAEIKKQDVDLDRCVFVLDGEEYKIYPEAMPAISNVRNLSSFTTIHRGILRRADRVDSDQLLRGIKTDMNPDTARRKYYQMFKKDKDLDFKNVHRSGVFYRAYMSEVLHEEDPSLAFRIMALEKAQSIHDEGVDNKKRGRYLREFQNDILKDYQEWKDTFAVR